MAPQSAQKDNSPCVFSIFHFSLFLLRGSPDFYFHRPWWAHPILVTQQNLTGTSTSVHCGQSLGRAHRCSEFTNFREIPDGVLWPEKRHKCQWFTQPPLLGQHRPASITRRRQCSMSAIVPTNQQWAEQGMLSWVRGDRGGQAFILAHKQNSSWVPTLC